MRADALGMFWQDEPVVKIPKPPTPKKVAPARTWESPDYLPGLEEARAFNVPLFTFNDLIRAQGEPLLFDIECYSNYFLAAFMSYKTGKVCYFEMTTGTALDIQTLNWVVHNFELVTFNGITYDAVILALALSGASCEVLKWASTQIIVMGARPQDILRECKVKKLKLNHVDLIEVAPLRASLKIYAGRLHCRKMQDLPFHPDTVLSAEQITITRWYCVNDLFGTGLLKNELAEELTLRDTLSNDYGMDLRSRSDAQIAEHVIAHEVGALNGQRPQKPTIDIGTQYRYDVPSYIQYDTAAMQSALETVRNSIFEVDMTGSVGTPGSLKDLKINLGQATYTMGIGGLHSTESHAIHYADEDTVIEDRDVTSYYPQIILNLGLYPKHLGSNFLKVYQGLVNRRIAAKKAGHKAIADSLKIVVNGAYGKLGSQFSIMYAPDLLIQVTLTGQLAVLMLIERLEMRGFTVISANTDGVTIKSPKSRYDEMLQIVSSWEEVTKFQTEGTNYKAIYSKDVNNYIAVYTKPKGGETSKSKGAYAPTGMKKNPTNRIVVDAVTALLVDKIPLYETILKCTDIRKFIQVRTVKGGAVKNGSYLGKAIRWYYAREEEGEIICARNGHTVPRSAGAKPLMELPNEMPTDVDYERYIAEADAMLKDLGYQ